MAASTESKKQTGQQEAIEEKIENVSTEKVIEKVQSDRTSKDLSDGSIVDKETTNSLEGTNIHTYSSIDMNEFGEMMTNFLDFQKKLLDSWTPAFEEVLEAYYKNFMSPDALSHGYIQFITWLSNMTKAANTFSMWSGASVSDAVDSGDKSDESTTNVSATFSCVECGQTFCSRQELKEHMQDNSFHA